MARPPAPTRRDAMGLAVAAMAAPGAAWAAPPALTPYGATPSPPQLAWQAMEANAFIHFSVNTFTDREWGYGDESPRVFDPTDFSADQIVGAAKSAGLRGLILVAKHHDGFCLWPSAFTEHSVKNSPFRGGKGDVVREISEACARAGLKFGVYLSPWDRHSAVYGTPAYLTYYRNQLRELLTNYGPVFEVWFDGANGGDGDYGGARETRKIPEGYYDFPTIMALVRQLQPDAVTFGELGTDLRWVGDEEGYAGDPCWATMDAGPYTQAKGMSGVRGGALWRPAETDVSLRPGWFWHAQEEGQARSPANLMKLYFESTGRGANILLNLPPDTRGRIPDEDARNLAAWGAARRAMFATNLAQGAKALSGRVRGGSATYAASHVLDGRADSFWSPDDGAVQPRLTLELAAARTFDVVRLRERLPLGLRVTTFAIDVEAPAGGWREVARKQGIGALRLVRLPAPVTAQRVRLRVVETAATPAITEFALFRTPILVDTPSIARDRAGRVTLTAEADAAIFYTLDGSEPSRASQPYAGPVALAQGGVVRAVAVDRASGQVSPPALRRYDLAKADWSIVRASAPHAERLIDEADDTVWNSPLHGPEGQPCEVVIDLGRTILTRGFVLKPAAIRGANVDAPSAYAIQVADDPQFTGAPAQPGEFPNIDVSQTPQRIRFPKALSGRYVRLVLPRAAGGGDTIAFAEFSVITR